LPKPGLSLDDIRARTHPADRQRIAEEMAAALDDASKASVRTRFRIQRQDGSTVWLEARERIERDGDGRAIRTAGVMHAVTGRKRAEPPEDQSWRRFEAALANTSVVVFQQDLALRYTWIHNPKLGFDAQSVLGKTDCELTGPELARPLDAIKRGVIETGQSARREVTMQGPGARGRYDLYVEPRRDDSGAIVGVTCAAIEIAVERGGAGAPSKLRQAISDRDALLDRIDGARNDTGARPRPVHHLHRRAAAQARRLRHADPRRRRAAGADGEKAALRPQPDKELEIGASSANRTWLIGNGWVYSYKALASGERQVSGFHLPGDLIGASGPGGDRGHLLRCGDGLRRCASSTGPW
jgi:PAS domain-containing protein